MWRFAAVAVLLTGCASPSIRPLVDLPDRPVLPAVAEEELACLPPTAYATLVRRDVALRQYAEQLETVIAELVR